MTGRVPFAQIRSNSTGTLRRTSESAKKLTLDHCGRGTARGFCDKTLDEPTAWGEGGGLCAVIEYGMSGRTGVRVGRRNRTVINGTGSAGDATRTTTDVMVVIAKFSL